MSLRFLVLSYLQPTYDASCPDLLYVAQLSPDMYESISAQILGVDFEAVQLLEGEATIGCKSTRH